MSINIGDNFKYLGKKFLDDRESFTTLELMKNCNDVPNGFITYCEETKNRYEYHSDNEVNDATGKWKLYVVNSSGSGGSSAGMTDEEREMLNKKFDDVIVGKTVDEDKNELTTLTFLSNENEIKTVQFAGGGESVKGGKLITTLGDNVQIEATDNLIIPYTFSSPNYGNATLYITIINGESTKELEYPIVKQGAGSVNLGAMLKGVNYISMYAVDVMAKLTNIISLTVVCGALELSSTFDDGVDYASYSSISIPFNVSALDRSETMNLNVDIDGNKYTQQVFDGYNTFIFPNELKVVGVHKVTMQIISDKFYSKILEYNIVIADNTTVLISTKSVSLNLEEGYNVAISFRVSTTKVSTYIANYTLDGKDYKTENVVIGNNTFNANYRDFPLGNHTLIITVTAEDGSITNSLPISINIVPSSFKRIEHVTGGLEAYFDMSLGSNNNDSRDTLVSVVPSSNGKYAELKLHDYNYATNGWIDGRLVNNGKAWAEIENYLPLTDNVIDGFTFDILFKNYNSGDNDARVVDCTGDTTPYIGFFIDSEKAVATTEANKLRTYYTDRTDMRVTFVVNRTSTYYEEFIIDENGFSVLNPNPTYKPNPMIQTYIDGIFTEVAMLSDTGQGNNKIYESFMNNEKVLINTDKDKKVFGSNEIKSIRIYSRPLSHEEILQNYMADYDDLMEQKAIYDKNYVTVDSDLPTLNFYDTEIGKCDLMTKDNKQWINVVYTSPNKDLFGESFDLMGQTSWQGTSSLAYPIKNYKFKLYDWARDENGDIIEESKWDKNTYKKKKINIYPADPNGFPENTYCLKADYMDKQILSLC